MSLWLMDSKHKMEAALKQSRRYQISNNFAGLEFLQRHWLDRHPTNVMG